MSGINLNDFQELVAVLLFVGSVTVVFTWSAKIVLFIILAAKNKSVQDVMHNVPENIFRVFLYHYPDFIEEMEKHKIDLYLAGHTHGGHFALPFYGALVTLSSRGKQFEAGLYQRGGTTLYVNRGIGMEGGIAPRVRFCARPEVTVIDVVGLAKN